MINAVLERQGRVVIHEGQDLKTSNKCSVENGLALKLAVEARHSDDTVRDLLASVSLPKRLGVGQNHGHQRLWRKKAFTLPDLDRTALLINNDLVREVRRAIRRLQSRSVLLAQQLPCMRECQVRLHHRGVAKIACSVRASTTSEYRLRRAHSCSCRLSYGHPPQSCSC